MAIPASEADGRHQRSARSRDAVVDAILELLREGVVQPQAQEIAERAGVSPRTVFRHFDDLEQLFVVAAGHQAQHIAPLLTPPLPQGTVDERVAALVEQRALLYEEITPVRRAALRHAAFHPALRDMLDEIHGVLRGQVAREFDLGGDMLSAVDTATSWSTWETLRTEQKLSVAKARRVVTTTVSAVLEAAR